MFKRKKSIFTNLPLVILVIRLRIWKLTSNEKFFVWSDYDLSISNDTSLYVSWKGIWCFNIPLKLGGIQVVGEYIFGEWLSE